MARIKLSKAAKDLNISVSTAVEHLSRHGIEVEANPNARIEESAFDILCKAYDKDGAIRNRLRQAREAAQAPAAPAAPAKEGGAN